MYWTAWVFELKHPRPEEPKAKQHLHQNPFLFVCIKIYHPRITVLNTNQKKELRVSKKPEIRPPKDMHPKAFI
ncbi:hypothetical protein LguiA_035912 [Lonicera macranthoides]